MLYWWLISPISNTKHLFSEITSQPTLSTRLQARKKSYSPRQSLLLKQKSVIIPLASSWKVTGFSFFPWWSWSSSGRKFSCSPTVASSVLLLWLSSFLGLGKDLGRNQKGMPDSMITVPVMMNPSHQAPTQRESLWLMVMVSGRGEKQEIMRVGFLAGNPWPLPFQQLRYLQEGRGIGTC